MQDLQINSSKITKSIISDQSQKIIKGLRGKAQVETYVQAKALNELTKSVMNELKPKVIKQVQKSGTIESYGCVASIRNGRKTMTYHQDDKLEKLEAKKKALMEKVSDIDSLIAFRKKQMEVEGKVDISYADSTLAIKISA